MNKKPSPLQNLLTRFGIKPKAAFQPYDREIPHPWMPDETLTIHYNKPGSGTFVDPEALFGERSTAAYKQFIKRPAAPKP